MNPMLSLWMIVTDYIQIGETSLGGVGLQGRDWEVTVARLPKEQATTRGETGIPLINRMN